MTRVLVVDDSAFMRKALSVMLESDPEVRVIGTARDGREAIEKTRALSPDVVTMDVEMPHMNGITAVRRIMADAPLPILMVSSLTEEGAETTIEALGAGAVDFIPKHHSTASLKITKIQDELIRKVKTVARARLSPPSTADARPRRGSLFCQRPRLVVIGVSAGGPLALQHVIPRLPAAFPLPVVVVQHMPEHFTHSLAQRLDALSAIRVVEAASGMPLEPGRVLVAPGGRQLSFRRRDNRLLSVVTEEPADTPHRPSVDFTFGAAAALLPSRVLAVIMTGMGKDGLEGARKIKESGGRIVVQSKDTCVVYGMPRVVAEAGLADAILPLDDLTPALTRIVGAPAAASLR